MVTGTGDFGGRRDKHAKVEEETHRSETGELDSTTVIGGERGGGGLVLTECKLCLGEIYDAAN